MLTANRLKSGDVLSAKGARLGAAARRMARSIPTRPAADAALAHRARGTWRRKRVVAPYLFEVREREWQDRPVKEREIIRARRAYACIPHTGKQAGQVTCLNPSAVEPQHVPL